MWSHAIPSYIIYHRPCNEAGGCLDGKQHLTLQGMSGSSGMQTLAGAIGKASGDGSGNSKKKNNKGSRNKGNNADGEGSGGGSRQASRFIFCFNKQDENPKDDPSIHLSFEILLIIIHPCLGSNEYRFIYTHCTYLSGFAAGDPRHAPSKSWSSCEQDLEGSQQLQVTRLNSVRQSRYLAPILPC